MADDSRKEKGHFAHSEPLLENEMGALSRCDCDGFVLSMGPMSLHLNYDEANLLHDLLCEGLDIADQDNPANEDLQSDDAWH